MLQIHNISYYKGRKLATSSIGSSIQHTNFLLSEMVTVAFFELKLSCAGTSKSVVNPLAIGLAWLSVMFYLGLKNPPLFLPFIRVFQSDTFNKIRVYVCVAIYIALSVMALELWKFISQFTVFRCSLVVLLEEKERLLLQLLLNCNYFFEGVYVTMLWVCFSLGCTFPFVFLQNWKYNRQFEWKSQMQREEKEYKRNHEMEETCN